MTGSGTIINAQIYLAVWSKAWVCGWSLVGIAGPNPPPGAIYVLLLCHVSSGRGLCVWPITRPEASYRVMCV